MQLSPLPKGADGDAAAEDGKEKGRKRRPGHAAATGLGDL